MAGRCTQRYISVRCSSHWVRYECKLLLIGNTDGLTKSGGHNLAGTVYDRKRSCGEEPLFSGIAVHLTLPQVAMIGLIMGPMYPLVMTHTSKVLPKWLVTGSIGWMAAFGQAGSAVIPFITGVVASKYSISALQPVCVFFVGSAIGG